MFFLNAQKDEIYDLFFNIFEATNQTLSSEPTSDEDCIALFTGFWLAVFGWLI